MIFNPAQHAACTTGTMEDTIACVALYSIGAPIRMACTAAGGIFVIHKRITCIIIILRCHIPGEQGPGVSSMYIVQV